MVSFKTVWLFGILSLSFFCFASWKSSNVGVKGLVLLVGRALLVLGLVSWLVSVVAPRISSLALRPPRSFPEAPEDEVEQKRKLARREQQDEYSQKASTYQENVLKPRQEAKFRKKEEHFYRTTGEAWKLSEGYALGLDQDSEEGAVLGEEDFTSESPNQEALRRRKLPESATRPPPPLEPPRQKRIIVLPEEPSNGVDGVVTIALRCPSGRILKRRFLKSHSTQVLLDWMLKIGYHPAIYTVCTTYPRRPLEIGKETSLEDTGITSDTVLNVDEKDPST